MAQTTPIRPPRDDISNRSPHRPTTSAGAVSTTALIHLGLWVSHTLTIAKTSTFPWRHVQDQPKPRPYPMSIRFHCKHCGEAMHEDDPSDVVFHCNLCGETMPEGEPIIILNVTGPTATDPPRRFSDYCPRCWKTVAQIIEAVEEALLSDPRRWSPTETRRPGSPS